MKTIAALLLCGLTLTAYAQNDSTKSPLKIIGYLETYYSYDFANPSNHVRPSFLYSYNKHNEVNLNLGFIQAAYEKNNIRANLALMSGTYAQYNLSSEHPIFQHLLEATIGVKISKNKNLWLDAGVMPSHIGFESAIGKTCWNLTRSILAENSPYYESGVKLGYTSKNEKWYLAALYLNGWQHIQKLPGNQTPAFGTQATFKPNSKIVINWSTFAGNEFPDSLQKWRYFNNFYGQFQVHKKLGIIAGFDIGMQQKIKGGSDYNIWYSPVLIIRFSPTDKLSIAARGEYYSDEQQVIISTGTANGFQTYGYSLNLDYLIKDNIMWRIEGRAFESKDAIFKEGSHFTNQNYFVTTSLAISF
jgi:hypothetical protein